MRHAIGLAALGAAMVLLGCTGSGVDGPDPAAQGEGPRADLGGGGAGGAGGSAGAGGAGGATPTPLAGAALYSERCAGCHGPTGQGTDAGVPLDQLADRGRSWLVDRIDRTMPSGRPERCQGRCAEAVADHVLGRLQTAAPVDCGDAPWPPRRLRLLNPREYRATVQAVLFPGQGAAGPCPPHTFRFDAGGRDARTVHVAGDFNGWAGTVAGGGWPMAQAGGIWTLSRDLPPGRYAYKFVIDERDWVADPGNPMGEDDGFGGRNSVVEIAPCDGGEAPDLSAALAGLVPAVRPEHFGFDTHAASGRAGAVHVDAWLDAAEAVAQAALRDPRPWLGCGAPAACPERLVDEVAPRLFRRALTAAERARWLALAEQDGQAALEGLLSSPGFLYRRELGTGDGPYALTGPEIASAMSYFLWGTGPDDALRAAAEAGRLAQPEGRAAEAQRMLADPRARRQIGTFAAQWLGVEAVETLVKAPEQYPRFDAALARDFLAETQAFAAAVVFDGAGTFRELVTADWTVASPRLAAHYALAAPDADGRVALSRGRRAGVLGHASVLATQAHSDQSSPIRRGLFVRGHLLCQPLPPAPANAGGVPDVDPQATTRERFRQHTDDPFCAGCHQYIDELGFGFEHFDAVGAWRDTENGAPIDARSNLNDLEGLGVGTDAPYHSLPELGALLADSQAAPRCFVSQLWQFALGRAADGAADACHVDQLADAFVADGGDIRALLVALVAHPAFVTRGPEVER